jgi:hypothetical protein
MAIAFVNSTGRDITVGASTWSMEYHTDRTGGAAYILGLGSGSSGVSVVSVADNNAVAFTKASSASTVRGPSMELWYQLNISSASTRVHVTWSASCSGGLGLAQFTGISTASGFDQAVSSNSTTASSVHSAAPITPASTGLVVTFSRASANVNGPITPGANFTEWISTTALLRSYGQYWIQPAIAQTEGDWVSTQQMVVSQSIAAFADTVGGAVAAPRRSYLTTLGVR